MSAAPLARSSFSSPLIPKRETLFEQVGRSVADLIRSGEWRPGEMLPNEIEMAARFGVSQGTMRRALKILVDSGVLVRQQGRGTFVAEFSRNETLVFERYIRLEPDRNTPHAVSPTHAELLEFGLVTPPKEVADALERRADAPLVHAVRLLDSTCGPVTYDELWLDPEVFRDLTAENLARRKDALRFLPEGLRRHDRAMRRICEGRAHARKSVRPTRSETAVPRVGDSARRPYVRGSSRRIQKTTLHHGTLSFEARLSPKGRCPIFLGGTLERVRPPAKFARRAPSGGRPNNTRKGGPLPDGMRARGT